MFSSLQYIKKQKGSQILRPVLLNDQIHERKIDKSMNVF